MMARLIPYLSGLSNSMKVLWCCLIWYVTFAIKYFEADLELWLRSIGIALLIGIILNLNAFHSLEGIKKAPNKWQVFRFFIIPFCVSSFPVLIKGRGFILFFPPSLLENVFGISLCALFLAFTWISRGIMKKSGSLAQTS